MSRTSGRRGLLFSALFLMLILALLDLSRYDSLLRRAWAGFTPEPSTPLEQSVKEFQRTRGGSIRR